MSTLADLTSNSNIKEGTDYLGGSAYELWETGLYDCVIEMAYRITSAAGAIGIALHLRSDQKQLKQNIYITSGTAKGGKHFYEDKNGEKHYLPGFVTINHLCLLAAGLELSAMTEEEKVVNVYNYTAKADVPTKVPVLIQLLGRPIIAAVFKQTVNVSEKDVTGKYVATAVTKDENEIFKFFRSSDRMTVTEIKAGSTKPDFIDKWAEKWTGKTKDKTDKGITTTKAFGAATSPGRPQESIFLSPAPNAAVLTPAAIDPFAAPSVANA